MANRAGLLGVVSRRAFLSDLGWLVCGVSMMADKVEVIRCIDCAKCREKDMFGVARILECRRTSLATQPDGYCAWAVRRENDG